MISALKGNRVLMVRKIESKIITWKNLIEKGLEERLPPKEKPPKSLINKAIRYSTLGGGHRYRPILLLAVADAFNVSQSHALSLACIVEMIHSGSMILDDLPSFDDADIRHGKPTCHKQFGEYIAIWATHRLLLLCAEIYYSLRKDLKPDISRSLENEYTSIINTMIHGEARDLATRHCKLDASELIEIYKGKSAHLFSFATVSGGLLGQASVSEIESLRKYGLDIGLAYQILDDVYDVQGGPNSVGKAVGMDEKNAKATTFPLLYGINKSIDLMNKHKSKACLSIAKFGKKFSTLEHLTNLLVPNI